MKPKALPKAAVHFGFTIRVNEAEYPLMRFCTNLFYQNRNTSQVLFTIFGKLSAVLLLLPPTNNNVQLQNLTPITEVHDYQLNGKRNLLLISNLA